MDPVTPFALVLSTIVAPAFLRVLPGGADVAGATDSELVQRVTEGDRPAGDALVARHIPHLLRRAQRLLGPTADAEDVVQDAFYEALRDLGRLDDPARFGPWVHKITIHQVHRRFRRRKLLRALGMLPATDDQTLSRLVPDGADPTIRAQLSELDALLATRAPQDRLAWMLRHVEGLQLDEIAQQMGCSLATVKRSIARVQKMVTQHFGQDLFEEKDQCHPDLSSNGRSSPSSKSSTRRSRQVAFAPSSCGDSSNAQRFTDAPQLGWLDWPHARLCSW